MSKKINFRNKITINFVAFTAVISALVINFYGSNIAQGAGKIDYSTIQMPFYKEYGDWIVRSIDPNWNGYANEPNSGWHEVKYRYYGGKRAYAALDYVPINFEKNQSKSGYNMPIAVPVDGEVVDLAKAGDYCGEAWITFKDKNGNYLSMAHVDGDSVRVSMGQKVKQGQLLGYMSETCRSVTHIHIAYQVEGFGVKNGKYVPITSDFQIGSTPVNDNTVYHGYEVIPSLSIEGNNVPKPQFTPTFHNDGKFEFDDEGNVTKKLRDRTQAEINDFNNKRNYKPAETNQNNSGDTSNNDNSNNNSGSTFQITDPSIDSSKINSDGVIKLSWNDSYSHWVLVGSSKGSDNYYRASTAFNKSPFTFDIKSKINNKKGTAYIRFWTWNPNALKWEYKDKTISYDMTSQTSSTSNTDNNSDSNQGGGDASISTAKFTYDHGYMRNVPAYKSGSKVVDYASKGMTVNLLGIDKQKYWVKYTYNNQTYWSAAWLFSMTNTQKNNLPIVD